MCQGGFAKIHSLRAGSRGRRLPNIPFVARDTRGDTGAAQVCHEPGRIEALVGARCRLPGRSGRVAADHVGGCAPFGPAIGLGPFARHDQAGAVLRRRMPDEGRHRPCAGGRLARPGIRVDGRGMGSIRPPLAPEVGRGFGPLAGGAGHRGGPGFGRLGRVLGDGVGSGPAARIIIGRGIAGLRPKALHRGPGFHQRPVGRELVVRRKPRDLAMGKDRRHRLARHPGRQQPVPVRRSNTVGTPTGSSMPNPANQRNNRLCGISPIGCRPDRKRDPHQARPDQPFGRDRGAAERRAERLESGVQAGRRPVHHLPDPERRMARRNPRPRIDGAERRPIRPTHHRPAQTPA